MKATRPKKDKFQVKIYNNQFDTNGLEYKAYLIEYEYKGQMWGSELWATSLEDAVQKLTAMSYGSVIGECKARVHIPDQYRWLNRLRRWFQSIL